MPVSKRGDKWYWGSKGPFNSRKKAEEVAQAAHASGYEKSVEKKDFPDLGQTVPYKAPYERVVANIHTDPVDDAKDQYHGELNYDPPEEYGGKGTQGIPRLPWVGRDEHPDPAEDPDKLFTQMMPLDATPEERKAHAIAHGRVRQYEDFGNKFPYERYPASRALRNSVLKLMKDESVSDWHRRNRTIRYFSPDMSGIHDPNDNLRADEEDIHPFNYQRGGATHSGLRRPRGKLGMTDKIDPETGESQIDYRTGYHPPDPKLFTPGQEVTTWPKHQGSSESARKRRGMENAVLKLMKQGETTLPFYHPDNTDFNGVDPRPTKDPVTGTITSLPPNPNRGWHEHPDYPHQDAKGGSHGMGWDIFENQLQRFAEETGTSVPNLGIPSKGTGSNRRFGRSPTGKQNPTTGESDDHPMLDRHPHPDFKGWHKNDWIKAEEHRPGPNKTRIIANIQDQMRFNNTVRNSRLPSDHPDSTRDRLEGETGRKFPRWTKKQEKEHHAEMKELQARLDKTTSDQEGSAFRREYPDLMQSINKILLKLMKQGDEGEEEHFDPKRTMFRTPAQRSTVQRYMAYGNPESPVPDEDKPRGTFFNPSEERLEGRFPVHGHDQHRQWEPLAWIGESLTTTDPPIGETTAGQYAEELRGGPATSRFPKEMTQPASEEELNALYEEEGFDPRKTGTIRRYQMTEEERKAYDRATRKEHYAGLTDEQRKRENERQRRNRLNRKIQAESQEPTYTYSEIQNSLLKLMKQGTEDDKPKKFEIQAPDHDSDNWPKDEADQYGYYPQDPLSWEPEWTNPEQGSIGGHGGIDLFLDPEMQQDIEELKAKRGKEPLDYLERTAKERFQQGGQRYNAGSMSPANYYDLPYEHLAGGAESRSEAETAAGKTLDTGDWWDEAHTDKVRNPEYRTNAIEKSLLKLMKARSRMHSDGRYYLTGHQGDPQYEVEEDWLHYTPEDPEYGWENWRDAEVPEGTDPDYEQEDLYREEQIGDLDREVKRDTSRDPLHRSGGFWDQRLAEQEQYNQNALLRILSRGINPETGKLHPSHNVPLNELPYAERDYNWTPISPEDHKQYGIRHYPTEDRQSKVFPLSSIEEQAGFKPGLVQRTYNRGLGMRAFGPDIVTGEAQKLGEAETPDFHQNSIEKTLLKLMKDEMPGMINPEDPPDETYQQYQDKEVARKKREAIQRLISGDEGGTIKPVDARKVASGSERAGGAQRFEVQELKYPRAMADPVITPSSEYGANVMGNPESMEEYKFGSPVGGNPNVNNLFHNPNKPSDRELRRIDMQNSIEKTLLKLMKQGEEEPQQQTSEKLQQTEVPFYGHSAKLLEELKRYQQRMQEEGNKNPKTLGDK